MRLLKVLGLLLCAASAAIAQVTNQLVNQLTVTGYPQPKVLPLSLDDAVRLTLEHNLGLQSQRYAPLIAGYTVRSAQGGYYDPTMTLQALRTDVTSETGGFNTGTGLPFPGTQSQNDNLNATLGGYLPTGMRYDFYHNITESLNTRTIADTNTVSGLNKFQTDTWSADAGVRVTQPLLRDFWTDATRTSIKLLKKDKQISDLTLEQTVHNAVSATVSAYYQLVGSLEAVRVAEADLQVKQQNFDETRRKVEVGVFAPLDEKKAQAEVAQARSQLIQARNNAADAESALKLRMSEDFSKQIGLRIEPTDKLLVIPVTMDLTTSLRTAFDKTPSLQAAREQVARQEIQLKYSYNQLYPRLDLIASWGVNGLDQHLHNAIGDLDRMEFQRDSYGVFLSFPLSFMRERNNWRADKLRKAQVLLALKQAEDNVVFNVDNSIRAVASAYQRVFLTRDSVAFAEADLAAEQKKFSAGKSTSFLVLDAATRLTRARQDELQALIDYNLALNGLALSEGTILEQRKIDFQAVRYPAARPDK